MSIKSDHWIRRMAEQQQMIAPFEAGQVRYSGDDRVISYGTSSYGYDVRCADEYVAEQYETRLLGSLPLDRSIRENGDRGLPSVVAEPEAAIAQHYRQIAQSVIDELEAASKGAGPEIVFQ